MQYMQEEASLFADGAPPMRPFFKFKSAFLRSERKRKKADILRPSGEVTGFFIDVGGIIAMVVVLTRMKWLIDHFSFIHGKRFIYEITKYSNSVCR